MYYACIHSITYGCLLKTAPQVSERGCKSRGRTAQRFIGEAVKVEPGQISSQDVQISEQDQYKERLAHNRPGYDRLYVVLVEGECQIPQAHGQWEGEAATGTNRPIFSRSVPLTNNRFANIESVECLRHKFERSTNV